MGAARRSRSPPLRDRRALALHYLVNHAVPDAVAAVVALVAVLAYLFAADWRIALVLFLPVLVYVMTPPQAGPTRGIRHTNDRG